MRRGWLLLFFFCVMISAAEKGGLWEISNGIVVLRFDPAISRIVFFGYPDGPNFLWNNPANRKTANLQRSGWINHGGERFWPMPSSTIAFAFENGWPPPDSFEHPGWKRLSGNENSMVLESAPVRELGIVLHREILLPPGRAAAFFRNSIVRTERNNIPVQIWLIVQIPEPEFCFAAFVPEFSGWRKLNRLNRKWSGVRHFPEGIQFEPAKVLTGAKAGLFSRSAAAVYPSYLFLLTTEFHTDFCYPECSNLQLYGNPPASFGRYAEMEVLGNFLNLSAEGKTVLHSSWEIIPRRNSSPEEIRNLLKNCAKLQGNGLKSL